jgi:hypothetical protein
MIKRILFLLCIVALVGAEEKFTTPINMMGNTIQNLGQSATPNQNEAVTYGYVKEYVENIDVGIASMSMFISNYIDSANLASKEYVGITVNTIVTNEITIAGYVNKSGDTMTGLLTTPSNVIVGGLAIGNVPVPDIGEHPSGKGAINMGHNEGTMTAYAPGTQNAGYNLGTMTAYAPGAQNSGYCSNIGTMTSYGYGSRNSGENSGTMSASGRGAQNDGYNIGTMTASASGAQNIGYNYHTMTASGQGAQNAGYNLGTMIASGKGAHNAGYNLGTMMASGDGVLNRGYLNSGQYCTNSCNGSVALLDASGNMLVTNHAAIVLGSGYSAGNRTLVADAVVIRSMGSRTTDAATKGYVDAISNAAHAAYVNKSGDTMTGMLTTPSNIIVGGLAIGNVSVPTGEGAINAGQNYGTMDASGRGAQNSGENHGTMTAYAPGAQNSGYNIGTMTSYGYGSRNSGENSGTMSASGRGAQNDGYNIGTMTASASGAQNMGYNYYMMTAGGQGAQNAGYNLGTMIASGRGARNFGYVSSGQTCSNSGNGSFALPDGSGNLVLSNDAAIVLGSGYSAGDRTIVADAIVIRSMGSRTTDAATKSYVDNCTNAIRSASALAVIGGLFQNQMTNGAYQVRYMAGETLVAGNLVSASVDVDYQVRKLVAAGYDCIGVASHAATSGQYVWVTVSGMEQALIYSWPTRGHVALGGPVAGACTNIAVPSSSPSNDEHWREIGHFMQTGTNTAGRVWVNLHFQ